MMTVMTNIFLSFLGTSASVSLIVAALMLLTSVLNRRYAAKWKYWIWIFLALRLLVPFSGTNGLSVTALLSRVKTQTASEAEDSHAQVLPDAAAPRRMIVELPTQMTAPIAAQPEKGGGSITLLAVMTLVWMLGGLAVISVHLISYLHYRSQVNKEGTIIKDRRILRQMYDLKRELHIKRTIRAVEYPEAASPMVIGFVNPVLILPDAQLFMQEETTSDSLSLPQANLASELVLKHELVHFKRGDVYVKLLFVVANAAHWFNPLIWMMQKEAAVDMELSCDESVVQGTNYTVRKAYTETLLSMLHRRCTRRTVLSTQFYGGKNIMKKRFKNILIKKRKKSGAAILTGIVILTISLGTLVGCRVAEETAQDVTDRAGVEDAGEVTDRAGREDAGEVTDRAGREDAGNASDRTGAEDAGDSSDQSGSENMSSDDNSLVSNNAPEATRTLTFIKEGEAEEVQAALAIGNGYSLYLPDGSWRLSDSDTWTAVVNEQVSLWVTHFEGAAIQAVEEELTGDGYEAADDDLVKREEEMIYKTRLYTSGNDVWGVNYCYPAEAEEGWGRSLPVIADTFAVSAATDGGSSLGAAERQGIRNIVDEFAAAYFNGNVGTMQKFLASTYEGKISAYEGTGTISDLTVKGLSDADEHRTGDGSYVVSLEYRDSNSADTFRYLTFTFVRQEDDWKIQFYGLEG